MIITTPIAHLHTAIEKDVTQKGKEAREKLFFKKDTTYSPIL